MLILQIQLSYKQAKLSMAKLFESKFSLNHYALANNELYQTKLIFELHDD